MSKYHNTDEETNSFYGAKSSWEANSHSVTQEISAFHGTCRFITTFTSVCHLSLSWDRWFQSTPSCPVSL